jgi:hypothetical protein
VALDGANNGGHANYTTTFTTANQSKPILSLPDFARGPDGARNIQIPNDTGHGIPITLTNAVNVTVVSFVLNFNPALLTMAGGLGGTGSDATDPASSFTMLLVPPVPGQAYFTFHDNTPLSGTVILGDILASVPDSAGGAYKAKDLLELSGISINRGAVTNAVAAAAIHVNAYFGDVTGNGSIDALDVATANNVAQGLATGFNAYTLLDPAIIGDVAGDISVDAGDVSTLAAYVSQLPTPKIPAIPTGLSITPTGPDPRLSLRGNGPGARGDQGGNSPASGPAPLAPVSVFLDDPSPAGSTGMTEAVLALTYDPALLSVSAADIALGSIPSLGTVWKMETFVDQNMGRIAVVLYSTTPIAAKSAGSLVTIAFHVRSEAAGAHPQVSAEASVRLVSSVVIGSVQFSTQLDDSQGAFMLSPDSWSRPANPRRTTRNACRRPLRSDSP